MAPKRGHTRENGLLQLDEGGVSSACGLVPACPRVLGLSRRVPALGPQRDGHLPVEIRCQFPAAFQFVFARLPCLYHAVVFPDSVTNSVRDHGQNTSRQNLYHRQFHVSTFLADSRRAKSTSLTGSGQISTGFGLQTGVASRAGFRIIRKFEKCPQACPELVAGGIKSLGELPR